MPREPDGYRLILERLNEWFPDKDMLTYKDCAAFIGCCVRTVKRKIRFNKLLNLVSKSDFARQICA